MGYHLSELATLPVDPKKQVYIFVLTEGWDDEYIKFIKENFERIGDRIGNNAVIAKSSDTDNWLEDVSKTYIGEQHWPNYLGLLPALLVTDAHPTRASEKTLCLFVPLKCVESRYAGWHNFLRLLTDFCRTGNPKFKERFQSRENAWDEVDKVFKFRPGILGISIDVNAFVSRIWKDQKSLKTPLAPGT